jgi:hypothetical protein
MITISIFSWIKTSSTVVNSPVLLGIIPLSLFPHTETLTAELLVARTNAANHNNQWLGSLPNEDNCPSLVGNVDVR